MPVASSKDVKEQGGGCSPTRWNLPSSTSVSHGMNFKLMKKPFKPSADEILYEEDG